jgi:hypothetical protein
MKLLLKALMLILIAATVTLGQSATIPISSQTLMKDTVINNPGQACIFDQDAKIVTAGFELKIICKSIAAQHAQIISFQSPGANGADGTPGQGAGGNGTDGIDGAYGRRGSKVVLQAGQFIGESNSLEVVLNGEDGGNGGNGGAGANGSNGGAGDGPNTSDCWFGNCRRAGGNGGNGTPGGNGGYGGRAGDGGNGGFLVLAIPLNGDKIGFQSHGGVGAAGGQAGNQGAGGKGGPGGNGSLCCGGGHPGADGAPGRAGAPGRPGRDGASGDLIIVTPNQVYFAEDLRDRDEYRALFESKKSTKK